MSTSLTFDEPTHAYRWIGGGVDKPLTSVTQLIGKYKPEIFGPDKVAEIAKKRGVDPGFLQQTWDYARDFSNIRGKVVHTYAEHYFRFGRRRLDFNDDLTAVVFPLINSFDAFARDQLSDKIMTTWIGSEIRLAVPDLGLAGTIDCLFADVPNRRMLIMDWKTNRAIKPKGAGNRLLAPLDSMTDSEYDIYSLQLSLYTVMLQHYFPQWSFERRIVHLTADRYDKIRTDMIPDVTKILEQAT